MTQHIPPAGLHTALSLLTGDIPRKLSIPAQSQDWRQHHWACSSQPHPHTAITPIYTCKHHTYISITPISDCHVMPESVSTCMSASEPDPEAAETFKEGSRFEKSFPSVDMANLSPGDLQVWLVFVFTLNTATTLDPRHNVKCVNFVIDCINRSTKSQITTITSRPCTSPRPG